VPVVGDGVPEDTETFSVFLSNPEGAVLAKALGTATVSDDDDGRFSVTVTPTEGGSVTLDPPGGAYDAGTLVTLTARPDDGYMFTSWFRALSGSMNPATLIVEADVSVTALFERPRLLAIAGANGSVTLDPPGGTYDLGSVVTLTAVPDVDHFFAGWSGDLVGAENPVTLLMDRTWVAIGSFESNPRVDIAPNPAGSVTLDPPGGVYAPGASVTLAAAPAPGYAFVGWGGDLSGIDNPATLVVDRDRNVAARFDPLPASLEESKSGASTDADSVATDSALLGVRPALPGLHCLQAGRGRE
jgi:hypothetical protein